MSDDEKAKTVKNLVGSATAKAMFEIVVGIALVHGELFSAIF